MKLTKQIKAELAKAYQCAMEISILDMKAPLRYINLYIAENVSGYGTAADEKVQSREEYRKMLMKSRQQSRGMLFKAKLITPYKPKFTDASTAQFHNEIVVQIGDKKNKHTLHLCFSTVFKYQHNKWQMVLFHGSMPDAASSTDDTFHLGEAEKKLKELEQVVAQRTADLQTKTRELEIEASLERVRTVTMAMNKPADILNICKVFFTELQTLGFKDLRNTLINFWDDENGQLHDYDYSDFSGGNFAKLAYSSHPAFEEFQKKIRKAKDAFAKLVINKDGLKSWNQRRRSSGEYKDPRLNKISALYYYFYSTGVGALGISTFSPISKEEVEVLKRFRNVFDMAYQRYVDIQKSETQAREVQIELALERVRARTMAMQHSEELAETVTVMFEQFKALGEEPERMAIEIVNEKEHVFEIWATQHGGAQLNSLVKLSLDEPHVMQKMYTAWKAKTKSITIDLQGNELENYFNYLKERGLPVQRKIFGKRRVQNVATFSKGILTIITPEPRPQETIDLLERFASVFEQTYTRFLDLQKAEAQSREAQIELGLERVRARAMAMQKSDELSELVDTVFKELTKLDFALNWCIINIIDESSLTNMVWAANPETNKPPESYLMKFEDFPFHHSMMKGYQERKTKHVYVLEGKEKKTYDDYLFNKTEWRRVPKAAQDASRAMKRYVATFTFSNFGGLQTVGEEHLSEENLDILSRFGKVFDLTYTRFNDLQKAEAQAREAQIEAALERVRGRAMAMHTSEELKEVASELRLQMGLLGQPDLEVCAIHLYEEDDDHFESWGAMRLPGKDSQLVQGQARFPKSGIKIINEMMQHYRAGSKDYMLVNEGEKVAEWFAILKKHTPEVYTLIQSSIKGVPPEKLRAYWTFADFKGGALLMVTQTPSGEVSRNLLRRSANVFDLAYRRFRDLKQAEAQARESQIQLALERVRARTMAMQHSDELADASFILDSQVRALGINTRGCAFNIYGENESTEWFSSEAGTMPTYKTPRENIFLRYFEEGQKGKPLYIESFEGDACAAHYDYLCSLPVTGEALTKFKASGGVFPTQQIDHVVYFKYGYLLFITLEPVPESHDIFIRFTKVFEQTYSRFLDLQKAEAQAREGQIQLALERVRARTMAMQHSNELPDAANILFQQVQSLSMPAWSAGYCTWNEDKSAVTLWMSSEGVLQPPFAAPTTEDELFIEMRKGQEAGKNFHVVEMGGDKLVKHYEYMRTLPLMGDILDSIIAAGHPLPTFQIMHHAYFSNGFLLFITYEPVPDAHDIFQRFGKVFDQTYTRFLDLQKAEAQAREAQIEAALERVRSRSMAMHKSEELKDVIKLVYQQLRHLKINLDHAGFVVDYTAGGDWHFWIADEQDIPSRITHPYFESVWANQFNEAKEKGKELFTTHLNFEEKNKFYQELLSYVPGLPEASKQFYLSCPALAASTVLSDNVSLYIENFSGTAYNDEENEILIRFGKVFQQTYTRFLDLQKAEAQTRESQIELALERVRAKAMAMQNSNELKELIGMVFTELTKLDLALTRCIIWVFEPATSAARWWMANSEEPSSPMSFYLKYHNHPAYLTFVQEWKNQNVKFVYDLNGADKIAWDDILFNETELKQLPVTVKEGMKAPERVLLSASFNNFGGINVASLEALSDEHFDILLRFAKVFDLTYTRFNDLQKAEAQAREAQIETALERVRSKTMAMHNSNDVGESVAALFDELTVLGVLTSLDRCGIGIMQPNEMMELWTAEKATGKTELTIGHLNMRLHTLLKNVYQRWLDKKETYQYILEGNDKLAYYEAMGNQTNYKIRKDYYSAHERIVHTDFFFKEGCLYVFSLNEFTTEATSIFIRFVNVFGQTYRRYLDLQKAEAQAREAQIEAALERVRSRTLAMQKSDELAETAAEVFRQLISLGIEPNRLYIGIVKEESGDMEMWATDEDGTHVGKKFMFNKNENVSVKKLFDGWKAKEKSVIVDMQGKELEDYFHYLNHVMHIPFKGGLTQKRRVQSVAYFSKGFIGMASPDGQGDETIQLLERFAAVFNLTFTRFNDLKIAEAHAKQAEEDLVAIKEAKQKAEEALSELQATQKQLIQSEKMASLGELTAGIAHEIQNPLNFVNNFSEVSKELLDEMKDAIEKGDTEGAKEIMNDVIQNLDKINHHGKRADGIVKGMLQHSRSSSYTKEPTDINALADEYLRLAYHGLRAKDKSFNATLKTDYDENVGNVNVISQDIGRVVLNLITNAFYVVAEKKKQQQEGYEPTVSVSTKRMGDSVEIRVKDNGNGIPQKILDKIFQPFFTTKPTGQGTGLGLSLSYDIVKAHGGEIKVETKENEGTEFSIILPL